jgi:hypothetical protein
MLLHEDDSRMAMGELGRIIAQGQLLQQSRETGTTREGEADSCH